MDGQAPEVLLRRSRRRTLELRVDDDGRLRVLSPFHVDKDQIRRFILEKDTWIRARLEETRRRREALQGRRYEDGGIFPFLGRTYPLRVEVGTAARWSVVFTGGCWRAQGPAGDPNRGDGIRTALERWYRREAGELFAGRVFHYARRMGENPSRISVRGQKRIWGSCSIHRKSIRLNWLLVMAPLEVVDYVIVHELAHLAVADHSPRFWRRVAEVLPDYEAHRRWLRDRGGTLILPSAAGA